MFSCFKPRKSAVRADSLASFPSVAGGPSCRRLSLDPYAAANAAAVASVRQAPAAGSAANQARGGGGGGGGGGAAPSGRQRQQQPSQQQQQRQQQQQQAAGAGGARQAGEPDYIEVNPLRRMSLPMQGQQARPTNELRRGSLPWAPVVAPGAPAVAAN